MLRYPIHRFQWPFLLLLAAPLCAQEISMMALGPQRLYAGGSSAITVTSVYTGDQSPADIDLTVTLESRDGLTTWPLCSGRSGSAGHWRGVFETPAIDSGTYTLKVYSAEIAMTVASSVALRLSPILFIETDKPIYKPGQTLYGRVILLNNELLPAAGEATLAIRDAKGIKLHQENVAINAFGVGAFELPLATELNFGTWSIKAQAGTTSTQLDVRVEKYVLPKFNLDLLTDTASFSVDERITGSLSAAYFFGRPVEGQVTLTASRYVGLWEDFATYTGDLTDGILDFDLPAVGYVAGTPSNGGAGSLLLEAVVTDTSDHQESYSEFFKVVQSGVDLRVIALQPRLQAGVPFELAVRAKDTAGNPLSFSETVDVGIYTETGESAGEYGYSETLALDFTLVNGEAAVSFTPPEGIVKANISCRGTYDGHGLNFSQDYYASYSPSATFIAVDSATEGAVEVGETIAFDVTSTNDCTLYYDVFAAGHTVFSDFSLSGGIEFQTTQLMAPAAKLIVYCINPNNEVSADSVDFSVNLPNATGLEVDFSVDQALPGDAVQLSIQAAAESMIGLSVVDESVYALNQGRLNLRELFFELEDAYLAEQTYFHPYSAADVFSGCGLKVMEGDGLSVPEGPDWRNEWEWGEGEWDFAGGEGEGEDEGEAPSNGGDLAEVSRVRQWFPETWVWMPDLMTDATGSALLDLIAPDSITTWKLHAFATAPEGIGITESELIVFQEFFGDPSLPYEVTRGETFPVRVQIYNYLDTPQNVQVDLAEGDWFTLLDSSSQSISLDANAVAGVSFLIVPNQVGRFPVEISFRSPDRADAVRKNLLVSPEGTTRRDVANKTLDPGESVTWSCNAPLGIVPDSDSALLNITPSIIAQTIQGLDGLLHMPCGCGEQNMIYMAPDVQVLRYLETTGDGNVELWAKAETMIQTGYQRELTYRHEDGSYSAFGESDESGSLWLTAFVLRVFSDAQVYITIDDAMLITAANWIRSHQFGDGHFEAVGRLCHDDMQGQVVDSAFPLTAFVALALHAYDPGLGAIDSAVNYLASHFSEFSAEPYTTAIAALAFARTGHGYASQAISALLEQAQSSDDGVYWGDGSIETTGYAAMALMESGEIGLVNEAIRWLASRRNSLGGYQSTQDTVVALDALFLAAASAAESIDLTLTVREAAPISWEGEGAWDGEGEPEKAVGDLLGAFQINNENYDVMQSLELPDVDAVTIECTGRGSANVQLVKKYNVYLPAEPETDEIRFEVTYSADHVEVDDIVDVTASVTWLGAEAESGMLLLDAGVPTGFSPVQSSLDALVEAGLVSRVETAGRKVIFYIDVLEQAVMRELTFQIKAQYPVRAITPDSYAFLYYEPEKRCEVRGGHITIELDGSGDGEDPGNATHSADWSGAPDNRIDLTELLRVIQLYNFDEYHCDASNTEDGYAPGPGSHGCAPHNIDYLGGANWSISLSELLRMIQIYNMGAYYPCPDATPPTEDGFCLGEAL